MGPISGLPSPAGIASREPLHDQPSAEINIQVLVKINSDGRQPETGNGADAFDAGKPGHGSFDWKCDELLDLDGSQAWSVGENLHLVGCDIGHGVDGQDRHRVHPRRDDEPGEDENEESIV